MGQTAIAWLNELTTLYTPTESEFNAARRHRSAIETRLDAHLGLREMFEIGSLRHGTGVWNRSDADFLACLKGIQPGSPWTMLNKVKETLQDRFPTTEIVIRRPAVVCRFSDADVEVVPAYPAISGYEIANPSDGWMRTYPKNHNQYVNDVNKKHNGAAKKLARQVKIWKYLRNVPVSSCYLEMRSAKHLDGENTYSPIWDLYLTLYKMQAANLASMNDPTGLGSRFGACSSDSNRQVALSKLNTAVSRAEKAKDAYRTDDNAEAVRQLKLLFDR
ncbi:nucleotidyltransferase [Streptomyces tendae]|uniref:SMODS domain-containing nucleotidyltransferase n=1 Tax=Streptomyces tendae TaxID=1932 RepID=UPI00369CEEA4